MIPMGFKLDDTLVLGGSAFSTHGMPIGFWRATLGIPMLFQVDSMSIQVDAIGTPCGFQWDAIWIRPNGSPMGSPLLSRGIPLGSQSDATGIPMGFLREPACIPRVLQWDPNGIPLGFVSDSNLMPLGLQWESNGIP